MKAAILSGPDSVPVYGDFDEPMAGDGSEIVELVAAGIHHLTRSVASGRHYGSGGVFPVIPGLNAVARTASGGLVFTSSGPPPFGTLAERIVSPEEMRFPLPGQAPPEAVAAGVNPGLASWLPLTARRAQAGKLGTVLVLGVTGMALIADGSVQVPYRTFPLSEAGAAWTASAQARAWSSSVTSHRRPAAGQAGGANGGLGGSPHQPRRNVPRPAAQAPASGPSRMPQRPRR